MKNIPACNEIIEQYKLLKMELLHLNSIKLQDDFDSLERIFHATPVGIGLIKDRVFIKVNERVCQTLGYARDELVGQNTRILYLSDDDYDNVGREMYSQIQEKGECSLESRYKCKDGHIIDTFVSLMPLNINDLSQGLTFTVMDISENKLLEKQLHESLELYKGFFEHAPQPYQSLDKNGYLLETNDAWRKTLGYQAEDLNHKWFGDLFPTKSRDEFKRTFQYFKSIDEIHGVEFSLHHKDGHLIEVQVDGKVLKDKQGHFLQTQCLLTDITERKRINAQLKLFRQQINQSKDAVYVVDYTSSQFLDVNESACSMLGYSREELLHKKVIDISTFFDTLEQWSNIALLEKNNAKGLTIEDEQIHKNGQKIPVEISTVFQISNGREIFVSSVRDISERKRKELELEEKNSFIQSVMDGMSDEVMVINTDYSVSMTNASAKSLINPDYISDTNSPKCYEISHHQSSPCKGSQHPCPLKLALQQRFKVSVLHQHVSVSGEIKHVELTATPLKDKNGHIYAVIESAHDITHLLYTQDELRKRSIALDHQVHHDGLTNLPNRILFIDRFKQAIKQAQRSHNKVALLFIDLDRFKKINDSLGHYVGDEVLKEVSLRLLSCIRSSDTLARLGGDEFAIILDAITDSNSIIEVALKIMDKISTVITLQGQQLYLTTSIGITLYPDDGDTVEVLLRNADSAMYKAKDDGRNTYRYYTEDMTQKAFEHILLESNLRQALNHNDLVVYYQPQVNSNKQQITGMEALVRWQHPELGLISPAKFIPLAENTGLIVPLGEQVLQIATKQMGKWMKTYNGPYRLAINLSVKQLIEEDFVQKIAQILKENECLPEWIELEVTEGYIMTNPEQAIKTLQQLKQMGFTISIDDFGTGYSSLSYLKRIPIHKLKIDQSFVQDITVDEDGKSIVISVILLAKSMGLNVIAEGVETDKQKVFLQEQGCESIQGYLYSRPVAEEDMTELLQNKTIQYSCAV